MERMGGAAISTEMELSGGGGAVGGIFRDTLLMRLEDGNRCDNESEAADRSVLKTQTRQSILYYSCSNQDLLIHYLSPVQLIHFSTYL